MSAANSTATRTSTNTVRVWADLTAVMTSGWTLDHVYDFGQAKRLPEYKAILTLESDACPIDPDWISRLHQEWDRAKVRVLGAMQKSPGYHVNGNALFSGESDFLKRIARGIRGCSPQGGWDFILAPFFKKEGWKDCPGFKSYWGARTMNQPWFDQLILDKVFFVHGIKDNSVRCMVRERFLP